MNAEFVRDCLLRAFLVPSSSSCSKVDTVKETRKSASNWLSKPLRELELEDRAIRISSSPVSVSETRGYKGGKTPVLPSLFDDLSWMRAVRETSPVYATWLRYCYSDDLSWEGQIHLCQIVWDRFWPELLKSGVIRQKETEARLKTLVWLSVQSAKHIINHGKTLFTDSELSELLRVHRSVFSRWIKCHWNRMIEHALQVDYEALLNASGKRKTRKQH